MAENKDLKSLWRWVKEESKKAGLKFNIQKTKMMAFSPIIPWQIDGKKVEMVRFYILELQNNSFSSVQSLSHVQLFVTS